jgi:hypothetical protein
MHRSLALIAALTLAAPLPAQGLALSLTNGVLGGAEIPYSPQAIPQTGITLEAWITYDDATLIPGWSHPTIARQRVGGGGEAWFLRVNAGNARATRLSFVIQRNAGVLDWCEWTFSPGQLLAWTHVAATYDGAFQRLFVNGVEVAAVARPGAIPLRDQGGDLNIGKGDPGSTLSYYEVWNGSIDELRLWPFARTQAEIQRTMNLALSSVPGLVSTWSFDQSDFSDGSSTLNGNAVGTPVFVAGAPALLPAAFPGVLSAGAGTPGCLGAIHATVGSVPQSGNAAFSIVGHRFPTAAPVAMLFGPGISPLPIQIAGLSLWPDLTSPASFFLPATRDPLGTARFGIPIPRGIPVGSTFAAQFVAIDPCGPAGATASDALAGALIP